MEKEVISPDSSSSPHIISPILPSFLPQCLRDYVPSNYVKPKQNLYLNKIFRQFLPLLPPETEVEITTHACSTYPSTPLSSPLHKQFGNAIFDVGEKTENYCVGGYTDYYLNMLEGHQFCDGNNEKHANWEIGSKTRFVNYPPSLKEETSEEKHIVLIPHSYPHYLPFCLHMESHSTPSSFTPLDLNDIRSFFKPIPPLHISMQPSVNTGIMYFQIPPFLLNLNDLTLRGLINFFMPLSKDAVADDLRSRFNWYGVDVEDEEEEEEEEEEENKEKEKNNGSDNNNNNIKNSFKNKYLFIFPSHLSPSSIDFLTNYFFFPSSSCHGY
jgi:hypothetical protein